MNREELQVLIDKVIGTKGIMRSSAWWVRRLFNAVIGYGEGASKKEAANALADAVKYTDDSIAELSNQLAAITKVQQSLNEMKKEIEDNELVIAASLTELNSRITTIMERLDKLEGN